MNACELSFAARTPIDVGGAAVQHARYRQMLEACGVEVFVLPDSDLLPDCAFVEDTAVVLDEIAIIASPGAATRRGEVEAVDAVLRQHRPIVSIRLPATLDGGDVLVVGRTILVGSSARTNANGIVSLRAIAERFGYRVRPVLIQECLHLKSACTALDDSTLIVNPRWLGQGDWTGLAREFALVAIPPEEPFAADVLRIGAQICLPAAHSRTAELIDGLGYQTRCVDLSEFAKAEGGVTCLSILF
jgi:dimethylargininase